MRRDKRDHDGNVDKEAKREEHLTKDTEGTRKGKRCPKEARCGRERDGGDVSARKLNKRATKEIAKANAKGGHGKAGNVLVDTQRDGEEAVQKSHEKRARQAANQWYEDA